MTSGELLTACLKSFARPDDPEASRLIHLDGESAVLPEGYRAAITDLLYALGALAEDRQTFSSPMAYYFAQSLIRAVRDSAFGPEQWVGKPDSGCAGFGARLVRLLELQRLECVPDPSPIRVVSAVSAVIKARRGNDDAYLMQWDAAASQFQPIGGKVDPEDASGQAALIREIAEELDRADLIPGDDYQIVTLAENVRTSMISNTIHVITAYDLSFYQLTHLRFSIPTDGITRWVSRTEMLAGRTDDGRRISAILIDNIRPLLDGLPYSYSAPLP